MTQRSHNHTTISLALAFAGLAGLASTARAQSVGPPAGARPTVAAARAAGRIIGTVVDASSSQPVPDASVAVRGADSTLVGGGFTAADGTFHLQGLRPGRYSVRVRVLGFAPVVRNGVLLTTAAASADVGRIALTAVAVKLSDVTVTAQRSEVAVAPDRTAYTVKDLPSSSGGSVVDVLRNVPSVEVNGDNKLSLRGNENVVVQINGRISPMRGEQLGNYLSQLPANMVAKVEVVANPSAKNDPEGMAGIVNIVLKENTDFGTSGGVTVGGGTLHPQRRVLLCRRRRPHPGHRRGRGGHQRGLHRRRARHPGGRPSRRLPLADHQRRLPDRAGNGGDKCAAAAPVANGARAG